MQHIGKQLVGELLVSNRIREPFAVDVGDGAVAPAMGAILERVVSAPCGEADVQDDVRFWGHGIGRRKKARHKVDDVVVRYSNGFMVDVYVDWGGEVVGGRDEGW